LLLILSILVPRLGELISTGFNWQPALLRRTTAAFTVALAFAVFFFWSRGLILTP
jgi:hypothetical protein